MSSEIFKGTLLVCDMDGTLLNNNFEVSRENKEALEYFTKSGGMLAVATGRMEPSVKCYLESIPINVPCIFYNGAVIYDLFNEKPLWHCCLDEQVSSVVKELMQEFPKLGVEVFQDGKVYFLQENDVTTRHYKKEGFTPVFKSMDMIPRPWYKVLLAWEPEKLKLVEDFLSRRKGCYRSVYSEPQFLELLSPEASKGKALKELIKIIGCSPLNVAAVGDNLNDLEMIKWADISVAVQNAHPELKKAAQTICCSNDEHVAVDVVKIIEDRIKQGIIGKNTGN